jgi:nucleoid-associated protein YgaU
MGTEMRIGIAVGVLIVAATSVYFIYGSDRSDGDLLITPETTVADTKGATKKTDQSKPTKPADGASRSRAVATVDARRPNATEKPAVAMSKPPSTGERKPDALADNRPSTVVASLPNRTAITATKPDATAASTALANRGTGSDGASPPRGTNPAGTRSVASAPVSADANTLNPTADNSPKGDWISTKRDPAISAKPYGSNPTSVVKTVSTGSTPNAPEFGSTSAIVKAVERSGAAQPRSVVLNNDANRSDRPVVLPRVGESWPRRHTIEMGDTLSDISMKYYDTSRKVDLILAANPDIAGPRALKIGRELVIPEPGAPVANRSTGIVRTVGAHDAEPPVVRRASSPARRTTRSYTVKKGDSFYSIAREVYGSPSDWKKIMAHNKALVNNKASNLRPGMVLEIPA